MIELVFLLIPGAITFLTVYKLGGNRDDNWFLAFTKYLLYTGLNIILLWQYMFYRGRVTDFIVEEGKYFLEYTGTNFWIMIGFAVVIGIFFAILGTVRFSIKIDSTKPGLWSRLDTKVKNIIKVALVLVISACFVYAIAEPQVSKAIIESKKPAFKVHAQEVVRDIEAEVESQIESGVEPGELGNFDVKGLFVERVNGDQYWKSKSGDGREHCVYMADGNGTVVYVSYKNKDFCITWSGQSTDANFIKKQGGWNHGNGMGWSKVGM